MRFLRFEASKKENASHLIYAVIEWNSGKEARIYFNRNGIKCVYVSDKVREFVTKLILSKEKEFFEAMRGSCYWNEYWCAKNHRRWEEFKTGQSVKADYFSNVNK